MTCQQDSCGNSAPRSAGLAAPIVRVLLSLFFLAQATPVLNALVTAAAAADRPLVELCTAEGMRLVPVDPSEPSKPGAPRDHANHDCVGCLASCCHAAAIRSRVATAIEAPMRLVRTDAGGASPDLSAPGAVPPPSFHPRAPPTLSLA